MAKAKKTTDETTIVTKRPMKYEKLLRVEKYDTDVVDELVEALNEITKLKALTTQLQTLVDENADLHQFVWRKGDGEAIALHNIDDEHLANIMVHLIRTGRSISKAFRGEALKRGLEIPNSINVWGNDADKKLLAEDRRDVW